MFKPFATLLSRRAEHPTLDAVMVHIYLTRIALQLPLTKH